MPLQCENSEKKSIYMYMYFDKGFRRSKYKTESVLQCTDIIKSMPRSQEIELQ